MIINAKKGGDHLPLELSSEIDMSAALTDENIGKVYKFVGASGAYASGDIYIVEEDGDGEI